MMLNIYDNHTLCSGTRAVYNDTTLDLVDGMEEGERESDRLVT